MITEDKYVAENLNKIHFTPLPFGNGNDICISLGWGKKEGQLATDIGYLVKQLINGQPDRLALWECEMKAQDTFGYSNGQRVNMTAQGIELGPRSGTFRKLMCCYFNLGVDAVISNCKAINLS